LGGFFQKNHWGGGVLFIPIWKSPVFELFEEAEGFPRGPPQMG